MCRLMYFAKKNCVLLFFSGRKKPAIDRTSASVAATIISGKKLIKGPETRVLQEVDSDDFVVLAPC